MHQMKRNDGNINNDRQKIHNVCADFYQELCSSKSDEVKWLLKKWKTRE